jgi:hypothetical protein
MQTTLEAGARDEAALDDVAQRGLELYESRLRVALERDHLGEMVAIHPDSGEFAVAPDEDEAVRRLRSRQAGGLLFVCRVGPPTPADQRLALRLTGGLRGK